MVVFRWGPSLWQLATAKSGGPSLWQWLKKKKKKKKKKTRKIYFQSKKKKKKKKKNRPEKFPFIATKNLYCISGPNVCKILFCSEFPVIARKWWTKEEEEEKQLRSVMLLKQTQK